MQNNDIEKRSNLQILKGSGMAYLTMAVNIVAGIVYTPWMIRQIGQSNYGLYTLAVSLTGLLMFDFGIGEALTRYAARYRTEGDKEGLQVFLGMVYKIYLSLDFIILLISCVLFFFLGTIYKNLTIEELNTFKLIFILVIGYNLISFPMITLNSVLGAYEEFAIVKGCMLLTRVITIVLVIVSLALHLGIYALVLANIFSGLFTIVIKLHYVRKKLCISPIWRRRDASLFKEVVKFSIWSSAGGVAGTLCTNLMPSIVAAISGAIQTAIYGAAQTLNGYAYYLTSAVGGLFLPKVTRILKGDNAEAKLLELAIKVGRILQLICSLVLVGFITIGDDFFVLWMGEDYRTAYYAACFLLFGEMLVTPNHVLSTSMTAAGYVKPVAVNHSIITLLIFGVAIILGQSYGAIGAAACIGLGYALRGFIDIYLEGKYLKVNTGKFIKKVYGILIPYILLCIFTRLVLVRITCTSWLILFTKAIIVLILYIAVSWLFVVNTDEKQAVKGFLSKTVRKKVD